MQKLFKLLCWLSALCLLASCSSTGAIAGSVVQSSRPRNPTPALTPEELSTLVIGNTDFAIDLYHALAANPQAGNLFYSPYSISTALAMVQAGAAGETQTQMNSVLHFNLPTDRLHPVFNGLQLALAALQKNSQDPKTNDFQLNLANATWGQAGYNFLPAYLDLLAENYGSGLHILDFKADPEKSRSTINDWVAQQTNQKILDLLQPGLVTPLTRLVLTNAIYFNAAWNSPFMPENTKTGPFTGLDGKLASVPVMNQQTDFPYYQGEGYQAVNLQYISAKLSMLVILPDAGKFSDVEKSLSPALLESITRGERGQTVRLALPKFKVESDIALGDVLQSMGMTNAFDASKADFSGIDGTRTLSISNVVHKSYVSVDEKGTEAAAATAVAIAKLSAPAQVVNFNVDHPFIFFILDGESGSVLFMGRVTGF